MNGAGARSAAVPPDVRKVSDLPRGESIVFTGLCPELSRALLACDRAQPQQIFC
jgi:hypothetical protein